MIILAGLDSSSAYGGIGSSRAVMVSILAEPTLIVVFVGITLLAKAMLPFVVNHLLVSSWAVYWSPAHLFLVAAFFILLLVETDRMPIHSSTHIEVYMIEEGRILEYSGPLLALLKWASAMKQFILYTIFCNVLIFPWGLSVKGAALGAAGSGGGPHREVRPRRLRGRLRRDRPVAPALLPLSGAARRIVSPGGAGDRRNPIELARMLIEHLDPLASSLFSLLAIASLLLSFVMLGSRWLKNYLYAFAAESWIIAALSAAVGFYGDYPELYLIAILTLLFRGLLLPYLIWRIIRRLDVDREIHVILQPSTSLVVGAFVVMFALSVSFRVATEFHLELTVAVLALTVMLSMKLIGFLMLSVRHEAISQILGLLVLENGIFLGSQILVPGMPLLIELVILFDLLIIVACFGVLVRYLVTHVGTTSALELKRLVG